MTLTSGTRFGPYEITGLIGVGGMGRAWGADDYIVFATSTSKGLLRVPAAGGEPQVFTTVDATNGETAARILTCVPASGDDLEPLLKQIGLTAAP